MSSDFQIRLLVQTILQNEDQLKQLKKDLDGLESGGKKAAGGVDQIGKAIDQFIGAATAAVVAGKKLYAWAREGAELQYMEERFDRLAQSIGTTAEALDIKLAAATGGLMSQAERMDAAGQMMGLGLAKTTDQVVRMSRVAGMLNMDMNQLVLTLTNQTMMRFDALRVSTDGFKERLEELQATGMDTNEAFTEAFLQQAEMQIDKLGSATESSIAPVSRLEASVDDLKNSTKELAANGLFPASGGLTSFFGALAEGINRINDTEKLSDVLFNLIDTGVIAGKWADRFATSVQWGNNVEAARVFTDALDYSVENLGVDTKELTFDTAESAEAFVYWVNRSRPYLDKTEDVGEVTEEAALQIYEMGKATIEAAHAAELAANKYDDLFSSVNRDFGAEFSGFREDAEWMMAGGGSFDVFSNTLKAAYVTVGQLGETGESAMGVIDDGVVQATFAYHRLQQDLGNVSAWDAAKSAAAELGIPVEEARAGIAAVQNAVEMIDGLEAQLRIYVDIITSGKLPSVLNNQIDATVGENQTGGNDTNPGDIIYGAATGAEGLVPKGYPNDSFLMGLTEGEYVQVLTPQQQRDAARLGQAPAGGNTINFYGPVRLNSKDARMMDIMGLRVS